jgi:hypothetical protein
VNTDPSKLQSVADPAEIEQLLALGHESRHFELKGPGDLKDKVFSAKVARAAMAMGNLRDGGMVCLGIDDKSIAEMLPGLSPDQVDEWTNFDIVSDQLARYSDPPVTFHSQVVELSSGATVVVLVVQEFSRELHVCKRNFPEVLQQGQTYVRPRGTPRSSHVPSATEMRELHDLAIEKGVREFVRRAGAAGIPLFGRNQPAMPTADDRFADEVAAAWEKPSVIDSPAAGAVNHGIALPAYTSICIQPGPFDSNRLSPAELESFITGRAVRLRGWPVPMVDRRVPFRRYGNWIAQDVDSGIVPHVEAWRLFTSGQFVQRRIVATDLRDNEQLRPWAPGAVGAIAVWDVLLYLAEVAELAARFATVLSVEKVLIDVKLHNVADRQLISGEAARDLDDVYMVATNQVAAREQFDIIGLAADPRAAGILLTQQIIRQFGLDVHDQVLRQWQEQILES